METKPDLVTRYLVRRDADRAEIRLMIALLQDAVGCFQRHLLARDKMRRGLFREAEAWVMSEESARPFSFDHVCDVVGLNADYLRRLLRQWRDRELVARGLSPHTGEGACVELAAMGPADVGVQRRERRTFTNEFKAETVQLVFARGRRIRAVARELGLSVSLVSSWVRRVEMSAAGASADHEGLERLPSVGRSRIQPELTEDAPAPLAKKIA